ncbi:GNAT family N-acetyltransferase [Actinoplanes sp. NPDC049265]|uniref:GNAT family N-acetyltransferase n=1 Tax=Actinoplanes sp. NPDC049265 TaxID=3363902 RepID=UPI0037106162
MTIAQPTIRPADPVTDSPLVIETLWMAFCEAAPAKHLVPDRAERLRIYPLYFELMIEHAFRHGQVEVTDDLNGVAVWYRLSGTPLQPLPHYRRRLQQATEPYTDNFIALDATMEAHHPKSVVHDYLAFLAVRPSHQGHGYSGRLLDHHHQQLDRGVGRVAYLEALDERTVELYSRHGYLTLPTFHTASEGVSLHPMVRGCKTQTTSSEPPDDQGMRLVAIAEVRALLGSPCRNDLLRITRKPSFPEPVAHLRLGRVWDADDIETWIAENPPPVGEPQVREGRWDRRTAAAVR